MFMKKSLLKLCLLVGILVGMPLQVLAQSLTIQGTVSDDEDVIIGASVKANGGSSVGTVTDINGAYKLTVPAGTKTLTISYVGYETQTVQINGRQNIDVKLVAQNTLLNEVVAIGYAKVKRKDLTGSSMMTSSNSATSCSMLYSILRKASSPFSANI